MYLFQPQLKSCVTFASLSEMQKYGDLLEIPTIARDFLAKTAGFCTALISELSFEQEEKLKLPITVRNFYRTMSGSYEITAIKEIAETLSEAELRAILLHEEGHVVYGHLDKSAESEQVGDVLNVLEFELEADLYSAQRVGAKVLISAITKAAVKTVDVLREMGMSVGYEDILLDTHMRQRIRALEASGL